MVMRKVLCVLVLLTVPFAMLFAGGAAEKTDSDRVTIEYWHINSATFGEKAVTQLVDEFHRLHPEIEVISRFQQGSYGGLLQNLQAALAAGNPPAVAQIGYNNRLFAFTQLPHTPIESFAETDADYEAFIGGFVDGLADLGRAPNGVLSAVPYALSVPVVYINADLFRKAGLNPDDPPATWEALRAYAKQIRDNTG